MEKKLNNEKMFLLKRTFFIEENINENMKNTYLISEIYFYTENVCVTNKIYKSFLHIYSFCKKDFMIHFFDHKKYIS